MNITDRITKLEQELSRLKAQCKCEEVDWSTVPAGTFVEVRDDDHQDWRLRIFSHYEFYSEYPFNTKDGGGGLFKYCRLAPLAPSIINWVAFDGNNKPDYSSDKIFLFYNKNGMSVGKPSEYISLNNYTHYAVIEGPKT